MANIIIFDLDGTLCDVEHRRHHVAKYPKNWDAFFAGIPNDPVNAPVADLHDILVENEYADYSIVYCTGRAEQYRRVSEQWIVDNLSGPNTFTLLMRPDGDNRPDQIVKEEMWRSLEAAGHTILFMVDDRDSVVKHARSLGYTVFQCAPGDFDPVSFYTPDPSDRLLTLMVGPSGAGKTTFTKAMTDAGATEIVSTDDVRAYMTGSFKDQSKNDAVFAYVKDRVLMNMRYGVPTVIDATHLHRKDRLAHVSLAQAGTKVQYIVVDRPLADKKRDGGWRLDVKFQQADGSVIDLIDKHHQTFKSQERDILKGDGLPNVEVIDLRKAG
jgi:predicted kinase